MEPAALMRVRAYRTTPKSGVVVIRVRLFSADQRRAESEVMAGRAAAGGGRDCKL